MIVAAWMLRDRRRSFLWWSIGVLALVGVTAGLYPSIKGEASFDEVVRGLPDSVKMLVGYDAAVPLTSPAGYLHGRLFALLAPLVVIVFAISAGSDAIGGSEEAGTLEALLANPVTRARVYFERYAVNVALVSSLVIVFGVFVAGVGGPLGLMKGITAGRLGAACAAMLALALLHGSVAFAVGAATGRRGPAIAAATVLAVAGYLAQSFVALSPSLRWMRFATPWHGYLSRNPLAYGVPASALVPPLLGCAVVIAAGHAFFVRRDLR